ncbi:MAG: ABC transporter substrate-binding protein [Spirochaetaceae bacterium]|nr:ABC transporter substrate-binding protein [Spirochaetaceae bacterium]
MKFRAIFLVILILLLCACAKKDPSQSANVSFSSLEFAETKKPLYAVQYSVKKAGAYNLITIADKEKFLLVPQNASIPSEVPADVTVLKQPLDKTYLVSTASMDFMVALNIMEKLRFAGTKEWYIAEATEAMKSGNLLYAGKYSAPDFELLVSEGCNFAVENTMIYHKPEIKEKLEELGIPVMVDYAGNEKHPLGRLEWIKLYGLLFDREKEADAFFENRLKSIKKVLNGKQTDVRVAFFYVNSNGGINVRTSEDYVVKMIELAGGRYAQGETLKNEKHSSTMNIQMEDFYLSAVDADVLVYNSAVDGKLESIADLTAKNELFSDFKAVKNGKVYCTEPEFLQKTTETAAIISELNKIITGKDDKLTYLTKLE